MRFAPVEQRALVIAHDHGLKTALEPSEGFMGAGPPSDQIADPEETVAGGVELELAKGPLQRAEAPVNVARDEVASAPIATKPATPTRDGRARGC